MSIFKNIGEGLKGFGEGFKSSVEANRATGEAFTDYRGSFDEKGVRVPGSNKPNLLELVHGGMTDDKGLFQGGKENRLFGRYRDFAEEVNQSDSGFTLPGGGPRKEFVPDPTTFNNEGNIVTLNKPDGSQKISYDSPIDEARAFSKTFDPSNPEDVNRMQTLFKDANILDWEGNPIKADSQWGYRSQSGLDFLRSGKYGDASVYGGAPSAVEEAFTDDEPIYNPNPTEIQPIINADASNDFLGDSDPYGYGTVIPDSSSMYIGGGGGPTPDALLPNQFR